MTAVKCGCPSYEMLWDYNCPSIKGDACPRYVEPKPIRSALVGMIWITEFEDHFEIGDDKAAVMKGADSSSVVVGERMFCLYNNKLVYTTDMVYTFYVFDSDTHTD